MLDRRSFLVTGITATAAQALPAATGPAPPASASSRRAVPAPAPDPFTLGVASGDPTRDGFVLWTRLAPRPLAEDGLGGMPDRIIEVEWELAADPGFRSVIRRGIAVARPETAHSVHVEPSGLAPGRDYWYRFRAGGQVSPPGRTRTAPHPGWDGGALVMGVASCSHFEHGHFTAYARLAEEDPDLILHLGDYLYEYATGAYPVPGGNVRDHEGAETETLAGYRRRHAQYKTDTDLRAAHAAAPWVVVFDDHEVDNNWAGEIPEKPHLPQPDFLARRAAAFQAYYENMPLRRASIPGRSGIQIYRRLRWGRMAELNLLDTRQFRDDQACGDGFRACPQAQDPGRSITGAAQEAWLLDGFRRSRARWTVIGQQVFFAQRDRDAGPLEVTSMDAWDGYVASRERITRGWVDAGVRNPVVLTGDVHAHWAADLKLDHTDPTGPTVGVELVTTSISSGGDGADSDPAANPFLRINPHLRFHNGQRGYVLARFTRGELRADFRVLPRVSVPGAAVRTRATFVVEDGVPGLHPTRLRPYEPESPAWVSGPRGRSPGPPGAADQAAQAIVDAETARP